MNLNIKNLVLPISLGLVIGISSCKKDKDNDPDNSTTGIRTKIEYSKVTPGTPYKNLFVDSKGDTIVDLSSGNTKLKMFQALNYYLGAAIRDSKSLDSMTMLNMFNNMNSAFYDVASLNIIGSNLNASGIQLRSITATSAGAKSEQERQRIERLFGDMARLSQHFADTAINGQPGRVGNYLADAKGIEVAQIIQKSLIGATQLDYIGNVLLNTGLNADNSTIIAGKPYTQLEQNWDEAYGFLTLNPIYLAGSTDAAKGTTEYFLGSYIWEYNKQAYAQIYPAFLKGRVAISNNDINEAKAQANFIRTSMEKSLAAAAVGYLNKWKTGTTEAARIHAMGEGLGFIYSLRYCKVYGADDIFSESVLSMLMDSLGGYWDLTNTKINNAIQAISTKFSL